MLKSKTLTGIFIFACILMTSSVLSAATVTYTYDSLNRLTMVYGNGTTEKYTYDTAGNRLTYLSFISDTTPDQYSFNSLSDVALNTLAESNAVTVAGINTPASISVSGGEYSVSTDNETNWTAFSTSSPSNVEVDTLVKVRQISSGSYATTTNTVLTIGGVSSTFSVTTIADTIPPTGTVSINSGATYTNSTSVTISLTCTDAGSGCSQMQFSNNNSTWSTPEAYATSKAWALTSGDGIKTVYVKFKDAAGNWSEAYSDTIILGTPDISASQPSLNFGNVNIGVTSASQTVTVTNVGTANLSISTVTLTGTNSSEFIKQVDTCAGNTLSPSQSCNVQIAFMPVSAGAKTAGLAITSNDPDTATLNIPLSGTGIQQSIQSEVEVVLSCPTNVTAGNALTVTVKLYNYNCSSSVAVNRLMMQLMGNSSGTLFGLGIWGPYNKSISAKTVPAATCDEFGNVTPGGPVSFSLTIMSQTPASLAGKMAEVTVDAITSKGESFGSGSCMVNVTGTQ